MSCLFPLHPHQERAYAALREALGKGAKRPIVCMPTGAGKTVLAAHMAQGALNKGKRVAFVAPAISLIDQTLNRFSSNGISMSDMGVMQGNHPHYFPHHPIQICSAQTIARRGWPETDFTIVDEAHLRFEAINRWLREEPRKIFVGLSATPWARGLSDYWDGLIVPTSIKELIAQGFLSPFRAFAPSHPDLEGVKTVAGDYVQDQLSERMSKAKIVGDVVRTWLEKGEGRPTLVFAVDLSHATILHEQFQAAGVASAYVDAETSREDRGFYGRQLARGELQVIVSVGTMTHGVDLDIRCIVLARPTKSEILFVQMMGRGLRTAPGKQDCLFLDHSDTHLRLGMITDIRHDRLLGGAGNGVVEPLERRTPLPWNCPQCAFLVPAHVVDCPACGFRAKRRVVSHVHCSEGELVEFEQGLAKKLKRKANGEMSWEEKAAFFGELRGYAQEFGYKEGWAAHKYQTKCGVWPNDPRVKYAPVRQCGPATRSWIRSGQIRWAKRNRSDAADGK